MGKQDYKQSASNPVNRYMPPGHMPSHCTVASTETAVVMPGSIAAQDGHHF